MPDAYADDAERYAEWMGEGRFNEPADDSRRGRMRRAIAKNPPPCRKGYILHRWDGRNTRPPRTDTCERCGAQRIRDGFSPSSWLYQMP